MPFLQLLSLCLQKTKRVAARSEPKHEQAHHIIDNGSDNNKYNLHRVNSGSSKPLLVANHEIEVSIQKWKLTLEYQSL